MASMSLTSVRNLMLSQNLCDVNYVLHRLFGFDINFRGAFCLRKKDGDLAALPKLASKLVGSSDRICLGLLRTAMPS